MKPNSKSGDLDSTDASSDSDVNFKIKKRKKREISDSDEDSTPNVKKRSKSENSLFSGSCSSNNANYISKKGKQLVKNKQAFSSKSSRKIESDSDFSDDETENYNRRRGMRNLDSDLSDNSDLFNDLASTKKKKSKSNKLTSDESLSEEEEQRPGQSSSSSRNKGASSNRGKSTGKKKKPVVILNESEDTDESMNFTRKTRNKKRSTVVDSESDDSESDDSENRRSKSKRDNGFSTDDTQSSDSTLSSDEADSTEFQSNIENYSSTSDTSEWEEEENAGVASQRRPTLTLTWQAAYPPQSSETPKQLAQVSDSDSGDENCEKCAICLKSIRNQEVASPEGCDHIFCSICLLEWSKNSNVCPMDRQPFTIVLVRKNKSGQVVRQVVVEEPRPVFDDLDDATFCEICGASDREDRMLLCDGCDRGFHTECLNPPLEEVPQDDDWYCPDCAASNSPLAAEVDIYENEVADLLDDAFGLNPFRPHPARPRTRSTIAIGIRTRQLERIWTTVNRVVRNLITHDGELDDLAYERQSSSEEGNAFDESQPSTSGLQQATTSTRRTATRRKTTRKKKRKTGRKKKTTAAGKKKTTKSVKRKTTTSKRKTTSTKVRISRKNGKTTKKTTRTRRVVRKRWSSARFPTTPKTAKGRLALTLGMVPPKRPGQLLPDVKVRPSDRLAPVNLSRARAGIPTLHIFGPRDELQYYSSGSDHDDLEGPGALGGGGVATVTQSRVNISSRIADRKKAALTLRTAAPRPRPRPAIQPPVSDTCDILGSILEKMSTKTPSKKEPAVPKPGSERVDVRSRAPQGLATQAPMYPGSGSRPGGFRPYGTSYNAPPRGAPPNSFPSRPLGGPSHGGTQYGPPREDREGYTNYLNNMPPRPTPFCRGGPPLRFRMQGRPQLRRIPLTPRMRPPWQQEEEEEEEEEEELTEQPAESKKEEEDDVDLYSDIETNAEKAESSGAEEEGGNYPALGPPPEPSAFLLGLDEAEPKKSDVYDPAEPCDSEDEMVIDEQPHNSDKEETDSALKKQSAEPKRQESPKNLIVSTDDDDDCPNFSLYSTTSQEFSQKEEEVREREIGEERRKLEELKLKQKQTAEESPTKEDERSKSTTPTEEIPEPEETHKKAKKKGAKEKVGSRLSFDFEEKEKSQSGDELDQRSSSVSSDKGKSPRTSPAGDAAKSPSPEYDNTDKGPTPQKVPPTRADSCSTDSKSGRRSVRSSLSSTGGSPISYRQARGSSAESAAGKMHEDNERDLSDDEDIPLGKKKDEFGEKEDGEKSPRELEEGEQVDKPGENDKEDSEGETAPKVATGLEGLDVEQVSSDNDEGNEFDDGKSMSSLSLSDMSHKSRESRSPIVSKKKKKKKKRKAVKGKADKNYEEGEIDDSEKDRRKSGDGQPGVEAEDVGDENILKKPSEKKRKRNSRSVASDRQVLGSKENKKTKEKGKDLSWKKPSRKEKNYRETKKRSKERARSKSKERRKSRSMSPKKDRKRGKDRRKKSDKKKDIERYDVRKIVKSKDVRKTDAFGRDLVSNSRTPTRSRSRSPVRERARNAPRRESRSLSRSRSRSRSARRGRSPVRRRYRSRSRSKSARRSFSRSRSRSNRKLKKKPKPKERVKPRSRSRGRKSRSLSRGRRRSLSRSHSRSPMARPVRGKKTLRARRSWSHQISRSPSFPGRRSRSHSRSPMRVRRSYSRSISRSWSRARSPIAREASLEKLTVVLTTKDKKKGKKKRDGKKNKRDEERRKKAGNSKEVFASGDNVLVSVNFRNNNNNTRNSRLASSSPLPAIETGKKKKRGSDYENERVVKKSKKSTQVSKNVVDAALSNASHCQKRTKKLTRLSEKDAEIILNRKPVAVIDLDISPYREQTPSPVNVVVVSDSGSGDEGKEQTPQRQSAGAEKNQDVGIQSTNLSIPGSPVAANYLLTSSGPKTPPEPQVKFSISKPQQLRPIVNPLGDDDEEEDEVDEEEERMESLDRRIEKELDVAHKGPNTPPEPRGPTTPKTPPSPQTSPDAYDPFEPTKSRSPSPSQDKENRLSPKESQESTDQPSEIDLTSPRKLEGITVLVSGGTDETTDKPEESHEDKTGEGEAVKSDVVPVLDGTSNIIIPLQTSGAPVTEICLSDSPDRKITVVISTPQNKTTAPVIQKGYAPLLKQLPILASAAAGTLPTTLTVSSGTVFSMPSPTKAKSSTATTQTLQISGIQRLQHRLGSPVNNALKSTPEKRVTPRLTDTTEIFSSGNYMIRNVGKRNGEAAKQTRPLQDATNETIDMTVDMDDSPYSPGSSEGDDLFDPPMETAKAPPANLKTAPVYKPAPTKPLHKSPMKQANKFDLLFGPGGPTLSPLKVGGKKTKKTGQGKTPKAGKKNAGKRGISMKMDEDQLRILDELPSSAVELQVKDKFLKKLNRQERVVDEVKTVLKPHYARKHITKEEYKDILRRAVPKICHSRSGEINPSKIQMLIEAYVRKFRHAKKKGGASNNNAAQKMKKKTLFS